MDYIGIDGCQAGWLWIGLDNGSKSQFEVCQHAPHLHETILSSQLTLIDIPIGLTSNGNAGRQCDEEARQLLRYPRACSIFSPPVRKVLATNNYKEGNRINRKLTGKGLSRQSWGITAKIREIDQLLQLHPGIRCKIRECHPEICFWSLNNRKPMQYNKKKAGGRIERSAILAGIFPESTLLVEKVTRTYSRRDVAWDDIYDALVCALVAKHGYGRLSAVPATAQYDSCGLPMEIVYL